MSKCSNKAFYITGNGCAKSIHKDFVILTKFSRKFSKKNLTNKLEKGIFYIINRLIICYNT